MHAKLVHGLARVVDLLVYVPCTHAYKLYVASLVLTKASVTIPKNSIASQTLSEHLADKTNRRSHDGRINWKQWLKSSHCRASTEVG